MPRFFNTAGPNVPAKHYCLDPFSRIDYREVETLIDQERYFVLHAPRQTGKTTLLGAMVERLNREGRFEALYVNVENAQTARGDLDKGIRLITELIGTQAKLYRPQSWAASHWRSVDAGEPGNALTLLLQQWARHSPKPIVLLMDEIDSLVGDTLISVLRQLRTGYRDRPASFPSSVVLCGVRDVRDYRIETSGKEIITGGSAFNVKAESLRLGNFSEAEIRTLYLQHTEETGQSFDEAIFPRVFELTGGQPWLVNALAREATEKMVATRDRSRPITFEVIDEAKERLILRRDTHLDQLVDKLKEERVRRVIEPMLQGESWTVAPPEDDQQYVADLGLVVYSRNSPPKIANAIYREVIPRELAVSVQRNLPPQIQTLPYRLPDGRLDFEKLMADFQQFFRENSDSWRKIGDYEEAAPQLLMMAFLQRVVNGGGRIEREYALGSGRVDLLVRWFYDEGGVRREQRFLVELKLVHKGREATIKGGLEQVARYAARSAPEQCHLVLFDKTASRSWDEKTFREEREESEGNRVIVWGM